MWRGFRIISNVNCSNIALYHRRKHRFLIADNYFSTDTEIKKSKINKCWKCGHTSSSSSQVLLFCESNTCNVIQKYNTINDINIYNLFSISKLQYNINIKEIEINYKNIQKLLHPDKFMNNSIIERDISANLSAIVNQAYQIIMNPYNRAEYIYNLKFHIYNYNNNSSSCGNHNTINNNGDVNDDSNIIIIDENNKFMNLVFELRDTIDSSSDQYELNNIFQQLKQDFSIVEDQFNTSILDNNYQNATDFMLKLKYYTKVYIGIHIIIIIIIISIIIIIIIILVMTIMIIIMNIIIILIFIITTISYLYSSSYSLLLLLFIVILITIILSIILILIISIIILIIIMLIIILIIISIVTIMIIIKHIIFIILILIILSLLLLLSLLFFTIYDLNDNKLYNITLDDRRGGS